MRKEKGDCLCFVLSEGVHQETTKISTSLKVISRDIMFQSSSFMYWDIKYVNFRIYFMKKVGDFEVLKLVFILDLNIVFLLEMF